MTNGLRTIALDLGRTGNLVLKFTLWLVRLAMMRLGGEIDERQLGRSLRLLLQSLGINYIKLGQYLASRYDILPVAVCQELSKLLAEVAPFEFREARRMLELELGGPPEQFFSEFESEPLGAASLAQVHRAITLGGDRVAVKIQRPRVEEILRSDMRVLGVFGKLIDSTGVLGDLSIVQVVKEVGSFTLREVDFVQEGRKADLLRTTSPWFAHVPLIHWDLSTRRVLTMELIEGVSLISICEAAEAGATDAFAELVPGIDPQETIDRLAQSCLHQFFVTGEFHGDPHPGNIMILPDGRIAFIDFGIFGSLDREQRHLFARYIERLALGDIEAAFYYYASLVELGPNVDWWRYRRETLAVLGRWYSAAHDPMAPLSEKLTARYQAEMLTVMRRNSVSMGQDQLLFWRALAVLDATTHRLPLEFDLLAAIARFFHARGSAIAAELFKQWQRDLLASIDANPLHGPVPAAPPALGVARRTPAPRRRVAWPIAATAMSLVTAIVAAGEGAGPVAYGLSIAIVGASGWLILRWA